MKIVIISDTHAQAYQDLPQILQDEITVADAVIHAGDIGTIPFYKELIEKSRQLYAVRGNNDMYGMPPEIVANFEGIKIAIIHSDRARGERCNWLLHYFAQENPDIIIFGHSHRPLLEKLETQTLINPGSPMQNRGTTYNTFAILTINGKEFNIEFKEC